MFIYFEPETSDNPGFIRARRVDYKELHLGVELITAEVPDSEIEYRATHMIKNGELWVQNVPEDLIDSTNMEAVRALNEQREEERRQALLSQPTKPADLAG